MGFQVFVLGVKVLGTRNSWLILSVLFMWACGVVVKVVSVDWFVSSKVGGDGIVRFVRVVIDS